MIPDGEPCWKDDQDGSPAAGATTDLSRAMFDWVQVPVELPDMKPRSASQTHQPSEVTSKPSSALQTHA